MKNLRISKKLLQRIGLLAVVIVILSVGAFLWWGSHPALATERALRSLGSSDAVEASESNNSYIFKPKSGNIEWGVVFYPGGLVSPEAYAVMASKLAEAGYLVIIPRMPLNLAVLDVNRADGLLKSYSQVKHWIIAGHSLGGAMAAQYAEDHPQVSGLILLAAYPAAGVNLADNKLCVVSIYGSEDKLAAKGAAASKAQLPASAKSIEIEGGNHAQFGDYGEQRGDGEAKISAEEQQRQTLQAIFAQFSVNSPCNLD